MPKVKGCKGRPLRHRARAPTGGIFAAAVRVASVSLAMAASVDRFSGAALLAPKAGAAAVGNMRVLQAVTSKTLSG